jgi:hypothetical protein
MPQFDKMASDLTAMLLEIRSAAPNARIVVLGYPNLLPHDANGTPIGCDGDVMTEAGTQYTAGAGTVHPAWHVSATASAEIASFVSLRLNPAVQQAVTKALEQSHAGGIDYVDPEPWFVGHELCTSDPWFNPITLLGVDVYKDTAPLPPCNYGEVDNSGFPKDNPIGCVVPDVVQRESDVSPYASTRPSLDSAPIPGPSSRTSSTTR